MIRQLLILNINFQQFTNQNGKPTKYYDYNNFMNFDSDPFFNQHSYFNYEPVQQINFPSLFDPQCQDNFNHFQEISIPKAQSIVFSDLKPFQQFINGPQQKESNPNLLKNIVSIIKTWVHFNSPTLNEITILWDKLKKCKKINQPLIRIVFGLQGESLDDIAQILKMDSEYFDKFQISLQNMREAHDIIRQQTVRQIQEANISYIIKNRRVKNPQCFEKYFRGFMDLLKRQGISSQFKISRLVNEQKQQLKTNTTYHC